MDKKSKNTSLYFIIVLNLIPVWGILQWNWTPFMVFYMFWFETLIISFFNTIKMFLSKGDEVDGITYSVPKKLYKSFKYLLFRIGIFFFYLLFIIFFIGFMVGNKTTVKTSDGMDVLGTIMFMDYHFNLAILGFILFQSFQLIFDYILDEQYKTQKMNGFAWIFDGRQIVIHVAVIISAFIGAFIDFGKDFAEIGGVPIWYILAVLVFCIGKIILELATQKIESIVGSLKAKDIN